MSKQIAYLDNAAATPVDEAVMAAMRPYFAEKFYNPSALYLASKSVRQDISEARESVASVLGARPSEIVFTAGGTEANNLAIRGVMDKFPGSNVVVSAVEHDSVLRPASHYSHHSAVVNPDGVVGIDALVKLIDDSTVLVSVMYANNETGAIQPISAIANQLHVIRAARKAAGNNLPLYFHTDACQAANYLTLNQSRLGVDMMTLNGGKMYGPKQSGCLFVKTGTELSPQILGGGQERGLRSGTENVPAVMGFATALTMAAQMRDAESSRLAELRSNLVDGLLKQFPEATISGGKHVLANFVHIRIPGADNERLVMELDERGVMIAAGSACSASNDEPSHVLLAMGVTEQEAQTSVRFTMGRMSTPKTVERTLKALADIDKSLYTSNS
jgi:cysteine desulfurase